MDFAPQQPAAGAQAGYGAEAGVTAQVPPAPSHLFEFPETSTSIYHSIKELKVLPGHPYI
jgi:hypothetical protein